MAFDGRTSWRMAAVALAGVGWLASCGSAAAGDPPDGKVRGVDPRARAVMGKAQATSPTVAALLASLESTDVVVMVQVTMMRLPFGGDMQMLSATATCRYLIVRLEARRSPEEQIEFLGHELQHAAEVAASDVRDEAGLARLMARIGRRTGSGTYETDAAVQVTRLVRAEVSRAQAVKPVSRK